MSIIQFGEAPDEHERLGRYAVALADQGVRVRETGDRALGGVWREPLGNGVEGPHVRFSLDVRGSSVALATIPPELAAHLPILRRRIRAAAAVLRVR